MANRNIFLIFLLITLSFSSVFAKIGDSCSTKYGKGTCQKKSSCSGASTGFTVKGACPKDPNDVLCCIKKSCKTSGICLDKTVSSCGGGGRFERNLCPGSKNVQCCVKPSPPTLPKPPTLPPKPTCPNFKKNDAFGKEFEFVLSRDVTKNIQSPLKGAEAAATFCAIVSVEFPPTAIACGVLGLEFAWLEHKADECAGKNQCLSLQFIPFLGTLPITRCVGNKLCC
ncbi:hypothetical protein EDC01DRAFT_651514 [Geopyxis carbonaria]|nr:hypothetical protein EDC01DRAFT_651514 [Geopyxis carbonaria]